MLLATSSISAPVFSQIAEMELMLLIRCASMELATSFESSEDQVFMVTILDRGTHDAYTEARVAAARWPAGVGDEPIITLSGKRRSLIAVPAARNSGLESTSKGWWGRWTFSCGETN